MFIPKFTDLRAGLVISYSYLWHREALRGQIEGSKDRTAAVILAAKPSLIGSPNRVLVAPITHSLPSDLSAGVLVPSYVKRAIGLDDTPSFIITTEVNEFTWPGFDLRTALVGADTCVYGVLPRPLIEEMKASLIANAKNRNLTMIPRVK